MLVYFLFQGKLFSSASNSTKCDLFFFLTRQRKVAVACLCLRILVACVILSRFVPKIRLGLELGQSCKKRVLELNHL
jgi:hypothetical protein